MQNATTPATSNVALSPAERLILSTVRRSIMDVMQRAVFTPVERLRANDTVYQSQDVARQFVWLRNVCRVATERDRALQLAFVDGSTTSLAVAA
ncbi:hypothetical protein [Hymenobacter rigui]|uniref:Uncharacterized protein n=1 Tax=Hymenobacter rigui TaxID=334424 RepID=A0A428KUD0_9BACT|nr:hypothetical protein [Hymenobacter rigui]RSK50113.1 hypothetical protein EI291_05530 [Hymenobacter rigui]